MFSKILISAFLLVLLQNFESSISSPLQSFDSFDLFGVEENEVQKRLDPEDDSECKDLRDDCDTIPLEGDDLAEYCEEWKNDRAVSKCRKTCGWCKAPSPTDCEDKRDDCQWLIENAGHYLAEYCQENIDDPAIRDCPKTCGFCNKAPSPTKLPPQPPAPPTPAVTETIVIQPKPTSKPEGFPLTGFQNECLVAHNEYRAVHGSPPLKWSEELTIYAQAWADQLARDNTFYHYGGLKELGQGENLAWFSPPRRKCNGPTDDNNCVHCGEIVKEWYDEIVDYSFSQGKRKTPFAVVGHFTQVVWKGTTELGMATAVGHDRLVTVARYRKAGNIGSPEEFKKNVLAPHVP